jgi:hypothetical protein
MKLIVQEDIATFQVFVDEGSSICMVMEILKSLGNIKDHLQLACPSWKI